LGKAIRISAPIKEKTPTIWNPPWHAALSRRIDKKAEAGEGGGLDENDTELIKVMQRAMVP
jgi:hypothetical protein